MATPTPPGEGTRLAAWPWHPAKAAYVYSFVGPVAPTDPRAFHFEGATSRAKGQLLFPNEVPSAATVWLSASWVNARGQTSVGSTPISFTLQGGAVPAAA